MFSQTLKTRSRALARPNQKTFLELNAAFPLRAIRSKEELTVALDIAAELMVQELDEGGADYLDTLSGLIHTYEAAHYPMPNASEGAVLRVLMDGRGVSQSALAKETKIAQSTISAVLAGKRELTREQIVTLAGYFTIAPTVFLPRAEEVSVAH